MIPDKKFWKAKILSGYKNDSRVPIHNARLRYKFPYCEMKVSNFAYFSMIADRLEDLGKLKCHQNDYR